MQRKEDTALKILITGSSGLIGSEAVAFYDSHGHEVHGVDNNMRKMFFGEKGDTEWNLQRLRETTRRFSHREMDIRNRDALMELFRLRRFDLVIHCAAQPSHDRAREFPLVDFEVNALATLNLLEACRLSNPEAVFIFMSTNKVYGDVPNELPMIETETRFDYARPEDYEGISEECRIDRSTHSIFGASKVAADVMVQEYGRYFGMKTGTFRGGCLTGSYHSGVELHGFLNYLVNVAVTGKQYTIFGYKGKQVRDNLHSHDVIQAFEAFRERGIPGEVYNLGGGRENSISVLEAIRRIEEIAGKRLKWSYQEQNRIGDHICYISDLRKMKSHFPEWTVTRTLDCILEEMVKAEMQKIRVGRNRALPTA
jgi:CDP-paratose 2-epimerase